MKKRIFIWLIGCIVVSVTLLAGCNGNGGYDFIPPPFGGKARFNPGLPGEGTGDLKLEIWHDSGYNSLEGAEVFLDGSLENTLSGGEEVVYINGVNSGAHGLRIVCAGFDTYKRIITVKADQEVRIDVHMTTEGGGGDDYETNDDINNADESNYNFNNWTHDNGEMGYCYYLDIYPTIHVSGDQDWFKVDLNNSKWVYIKLTDIPSGCNYDLELYDYSGYKEDYSYNSSENDDIIGGSSYYTFYSSTYYIRVFSPDNDSSSSNYKLHIEVDY